ncbi:MAG TPA: hypothetical protein VFQ70_01485 [Candidatus Saccharimonadaceae bacterium]|nr:hypothetical protein [Candidatus Saccharimonadaceae bacterium]
MMALAVQPMYSLLSDQAAHAIGGELLNQDFSSCVAQGSNASLNSSDWSFSSGTGCYSANGDGGSAALQINSNNSYAVLTLPLSAGQVPTTLSFWAKGVPGSGVFSGALQISEYSSSDLTQPNIHYSDFGTTGNVDGSLTTTGTTQTVTLNSATRVIKFNYEKSSGNLALDDVRVDYTQAPAVPPAQLVAQDFDTWNDSPSFKGFNVGFEASGFGTVTAATVDVTRADGSHVTKTAGPQMLAYLSNTSTATEASAPFVVSPGSENGLTGDSWWSGQTNVPWTASTMPTSVTISVTDQSGTKTATTSNFLQGDASHPSYLSILPPAPTTGPVEDVTTGRYFQTIQSAVDAANSGDTITVTAGTYNENVVIDKPLTIGGANSQTAGYNTRNSESTLNGSFTVRADNVKIAGFTINNSVAGGSGVVMQGNYSGETIANNIIDNNGYAINFNTGNTNINSNLVKYSTSAKSGIEANSNPGNLVHIFDNHFIGTAPAAVSADITVIGTAPSRTATIYVDRNVSTSGTTLAALFNVWSSTVSNNKATGVDGSAVYIGGHDGYITVVGNTISQSTTAINVANDFGDGPNSNVSVHANYLDTSDVNGVKVGSGAYTSGQTVDATGNWWGSVDGPFDQVASDGSIPATNTFQTSNSASKAVGAVNYGAWCTDASCATNSAAVPNAPNNLSMSVTSTGVSIANHTATNQSGVTASWDSNNTMPVTYIYHYWKDSGSVWTTSHNWTNPTSATSYPGTFNQGEGINNFCVVAVSQFGVQSPCSETFSVNYDSTPPSGPTNARWVGATDGLYTHDTSIKSSWTAATDSGSGIAYYEYSYEHNGSSWSAWERLGQGSLAVTVNSGIATINNSFGGSASAQGTWRFRIQAVDNAGNTSAAPAVSPMITYDNTPPVVTITSPTSGYAHQTVTISGTVSDANPNHYYLVVKNNKGQVVFGPGTVYQANVSSLQWNTAAKNKDGSSVYPDGTYTIDLEARDKAGNKGADSTQTVQVIVDNTPPLAPVIAPANGTDIKGDQSFTVTKSNPNDTLTVTSSTGVLSSNNDGTYSLDTTSLKKDTQVIITATETDEAGNSTVTTATYSVENAAPTVSGVTMGHDASGQYWLTGSSADSANAQVGVQNGGTLFAGPVNVNSDGSWTVPLGALPKSTSYNFTVMIANALGYSSTLTGTYTTAPLQTAVVKPSVTQSLLKSFATVATPVTTPITPTPAAQTPKKGVLGAQTTKKNVNDSTVLAAPSAQGWKILGFAWYWWLILIAVIAAIWWYIVARRRRASDAV